jgi:deoxycytidylate deaminase
MVDDAEMNKNHVFMRIAHDLSALGTCDRKQVGALIVRNGRCISWGYNGAPPGLPHCDQNNHGWGWDPEKWAEDPVYALGGI